MTDDIQAVSPIGQAYALLAADSVALAGSVTNLLMMVEIWSDKYGIDMGEPTEMAIEHARHTLRVFDNDRALIAQLIHKEFGNGNGTPPD